jgi:hypothetical protein
VGGRSGRVRGPAASAAIYAPVLIGGIGLLIRGNQLKETETGEPGDPTMR